MATPSSQCLYPQRLTAVSTTMEAATFMLNAFPQALSRSAWQAGHWGCPVWWGLFQTSPGEEVTLLSRALASFWLPAALLIGIWYRCPAAAMRVTVEMGSGPVSF